MPIPLGGLVAYRSLPQREVDRLVFDLRRSLDRVWVDPEQTMPFVLEHAQEMAPEVVRRHIGTYVTDETHTLSNRGWLSVIQLTGVPERPPA